MSTSAQLTAGGAVVGALTGLALSWMRDKKRKRENEQEREFIDSALFAEDYRNEEETVGLNEDSRRREHSHGAQPQRKREIETRGGGEEEETLSERSRSFTHLRSEPDVWRALLCLWKKAEDKEKQELVVLLARNCEVIYSTFHKLVDEGEGTVPVSARQVAYVRGRIYIVIGLLHRLCQLYDALARVRVKKMCEFVESHMTAVLVTFERRLRH